jgi:endonuclease YncB( thermonuclease family)
LVCILSDVKKIVVFCYVFGILSLIGACHPLALTYAETPDKLDPLVRDVTGDGNQPDYKIQQSVSQQSSQNKTTDIELAGIVTKVIDGDTLDINGTRIRLALVDTPERGQPGFYEAKKFVKSLCLGKKGELDVDDGQRRGDRYGREIGVVYCDGYNANEKLMNAKLASILTEFCDISEFANENWTASQCKNDVKN